MTPEAAPDVVCPLCGVDADAESLRCPECAEDLAPLAHLAYAGRIHYNAALRHARNGDRAAARDAVAVALAYQPDLAPAVALHAALADTPGPP
ncbi:hypothetical protein LO772_06290 [Yinghuangia sp. ASG 101]|uniref:hypothetical protein n=1 Tax=Yinghuangia sp. ASG 101 TaxID=2896848 RepID=UPI001E5C0DBB|nr:hypothetical protein [Yinghuangia sp. ASG 101]UGQ13223.1 hypothetical protein LO772_06290 [Yinghuangia sp. ASG 101]